MCHNQICSFNSKKSERDLNFLQVGYRVGPEERSVRNFCEAYMNMNPNWAFMDCKLKCDLTYFMSCKYCISAQTCVVHILRWIPMIVFQVILYCTCNLSIFILPQHFYYLLFVTGVCCQIGPGCGDKQKQRSAKQLPLYPLPVVVRI